MISLKYIKIIFGIIGNIRTKLYRNNKNSEFFKIRKIGLSQMYGY